MRISVDRPALDQTDWLLSGQTADGRGQAIAAGARR